jgi:YfiR/HmsC-like
LRLRRADRALPLACFPSQSGFVQAAVSIIDLTSLSPGDLMGIRPARMASARRWQRLLAALFGCLALLAVVAPASAQQANEYLVKAAFIYNFAKFTTWPDSAFADPAAPVTLCIVGKHDFGDAFNTVQGKSVGGRSVIVRYLNTFRNKDQCQVVYVAESERSRLTRILTASRSAHALTVSEIDGFAERCGMIRMVRDGNDRISFEINPKAAEEAGLKFSSRLLNLARRLVDSCGGDG